MIDIVLAWSFVITKYVHSTIRLTTNYVPYRAMFFTIGFFIVLAQYAYFFIKII